MSKRKLNTESVGSPCLIGICVYTANIKQNIIWFVQVVCSVKTNQYNLVCPKSAQQKNFLVLQ